MDLEVPGGSIGDSRMVAKSFPRSLHELKLLFEKRFGYDSSHNRFFKKFIVGRNVADLGCGHGFSTLYMADVVKDITGFDIDPVAVDQARSMSRRFQITNAHFQCYKPYRTNHPNDFFEAVVSSDVIEHVQWPVLYLSEAYRICAPNGLLLLSTPNGLVANENIDIIRSHSPFHVMEYSPSRLIALVEQTGFKLQQVFRQYNMVRKIGLIPTGFRQDFHFLMNRLFSSPIGEQVRFLYSSLYRNLFSRNGAETISAYRIDQATVESITKFNCDAIVLVAQKTKN